MTREQKLQAVVDACRAWGLSAKYLPPAVYNALAALDAHTEAEPQGGVTLAVWEFEDGSYLFAKIDTVMDAPAFGFSRLGTVTLPITWEGGR